MFCDLVGSTELANRLDPEEWRRVLATYHQVVTLGRAAEIRQHLAPIHDWFTEGNEFCDLREAKVLLDALPRTREPIPTGAHWHH